MFLRATQLLLIILFRNTILLEYYFLKQFPMKDRQRDFKVQLDIREFKAFDA